MYTSKATSLFLAASVIFIGSDAFRKKDSKASQDQKHAETLTNLQALARKVASGEEKITDASKLALSGIKAEMLAIIDDTAEQHTENQEGVDSARDAISFCGVETTEKHTNASGIDEQAKSVDESRIEHNTYRLKEVEVLTDKTEKCNTFKTYNDNLVPPSCSVEFPPGPSDSRLECIVTIKKWSHQHFREFQEKKTICDESTVISDETTILADEQQASFESGFCTYASTLIETCDAQTRCRSQFIAARDKTHSQVKVAEGGRKAEYKAARKILCLLDVLNATAAEMPGLLTRCEQIAIATSSLDIAYPEIPAAAVCDPSPVTIQPGVAAWRIKEYESQKDWYEFTQETEKVQPSPSVACTATEET
jgi:hypothetical protein